MSPTQNMEGQIRCSGVNVDRLCGQDMASLHAGSTQHNRLLSSLPEGDRERLERYLEPITLKPRQRLEAANRKIEHACFVEEGLVFDRRCGTF